MMKNILQKNFKIDTLKIWKGLNLHLELIEIKQFLFPLQLAIALFSYFQYFI